MSDNVILLEDMDKILEAARKVRDAFTDIDCTTEDSCPDDVLDMDDNLVLGDDHNRQQWSAEYRVNGKEDHEGVKETLMTLFGAPTEEVLRKDLGKHVNNWKKGGIHIIQLNNEIAILQEY